MSLSNSEKRHWREIQKKEDVSSCKDNHGPDAEPECRVCGDPVGEFNIMTDAERVLKGVDGLKTEVFERVDGKITEIYLHIDKVTERLSDTISSKVRMLCWCIGILTTIAVGCFTGITGLAFVGVNYAIDKSINAEDEMEQMIKWLISGHESRVHKGAFTEEQATKMEKRLLTLFREHKH